MKFALGELLYYPRMLPGDDWNHMGSEKWDIWRDWPQVHSRLVHDILFAGLIITSVYLTASKIKTLTAASHFVKFPLTVFKFTEKFTQCRLSIAEPCPRIWQKQNLFTLLLLLLARPHFSRVDHFSLTFQLPESEGHRTTRGPRQSFRLGLRHHASKIFRSKLARLTVTKEDWILAQRRFLQDLPQRKETNAGAAPFIIPQRQKAAVAGLEMIVVRLASKFPFNHSLRRSGACLA
jgi:hypothetical protein